MSGAAEAAAHPADHASGHASAHTTVRGRGAAPPGVQRITGARPSHTDDLNRRINRYLISMAVRTACVVLVFVVGGPLRWVFAAGAIFLPYVAVVFANASDRRHGGPGPAPVGHRGLGAPARSAVPDAGPPVVLEGQVLPGPQRPRDPPGGTPGDPPADQGR